MKKIILSLTLVAFALVPALQASEDKEPAKTKATCPLQAATCPSQQAASCPSQQAKCDTAKACCAEEKAGTCCASASAKKSKSSRLAKRTNPSIKGAQLLVMR